MTGHLIYGKYKFIKKENKWTPDEKKGSPLHDPFNRFVHVVFTFSNGKNLAFCDTRKFGKITLINTQEIDSNRHLQNLGPEPLHETFTFEEFKQRLTKKPQGKIKSVLMDQAVVVGIGNIYSDEILWSASVNPERRALSLKDTELNKMFQATTRTTSGRAV
jgi:formamidopyrimidine-DNA glycosylase